VTTFTYDAFGRVSTVTDSEGYTVTMSYDAADRVLTVTYPDGTYAQRIYNLLDLQWTKDRLGRWSLRLHDALRHLVATQDPLLRTTYFEHCVCGALMAIIDAKGNRTSFNRDLQERLTQKVFADGTSISLTYENTTSRLKSRTDQNGQTKTYAYNRDNSIQGVSYAGALNPTANVTYTYDSAYPRMTSMADGVGTTTYTYNPIATSPALGAGRLGSITGPLPNSVVSYTYDQLGRISGNSINGSAARRF
jgi:YD repeat-containing protein